MVVNFTRSKQYSFTTGSVVNKKALLSFTTRRLAELAGNQNSKGVNVYFIKDSKVYSPSFAKSKLYYHHIRLLCVLFFAGYQMKNDGRIALMMLGTSEMDSPASN